MCWNDNGKGCFNSFPDDASLRLLYLQQTIHQAVASIHSMTASAEADSNSASSQISPAAGPKLSEVDQLSLEFPYRASSGAVKSRQRETKTAGEFLRNTLANHDYIDYASVDVDPSELERPRQSKSRGGASSTFPLVLHQMLEDAETHGFSDIIAWLPHGRAWKVVNQDRFIKEVMPQFFRQTKFRSFQRQLCLYDFKRLTRKGPDYGSYYHHFFLRGKPELVKGVHRKRLKGCMVRQSLSPETEPDFWSMPVVGINEGTSIVHWNVLRVPPAKETEDLERKNISPMADPQAYSLSTSVTEPRKKPTARAAVVEAKTVAPIVGSDPREVDTMVYPSIASPGLFVAELREAPAPSVSQYSFADGIMLIDQMLLLPLSISAPLMSTFEEEGDLVKFLNEINLEEDDDEFMGEQLDPLPLREH